MSDPLKFGSKLEKSFYFHTLSSFLDMYVGQAVMIDLQNESSVAGIIEEIDGFMNVTLNEVVLTDQRGKHHLFENLIVHARKIRQIQLPSSNQRPVNYLEMLRAHLEQPELIGGKRLAAAVHSSSTKKSFKTVRAERGQQKTLAEL